MKSRPGNRGRVLLICGLPGSGKSTYAGDLELRGWTRLSVDHAHDADLGPGAAWSYALNGDAEPLKQFADRRGGVVIEWGFHPLDLPRLAAMVESGIAAWYFDGDREAAYAGWQDAHRDLPAEVWRTQVARLDAAAPEIRAVFDTRYVTTVGQGRTYKPIAEIDRILGITAVEW